MTHKTKKHLVGFLCAIVAMFLWIFVAVVLTGGREVEDFTDNDKILMTVFMVVEIATVLVVFLFVVLLGKERGKNFQQQVQMAQTNLDKNTQKHRIALLVLAFALALGTMIGGIVLKKALSAQQQNFCGWLIGISIAVAAGFLLLSIVFKDW